MTEMGAKPTCGRMEEAMRDLILKMSLSIDGFVGGPDGGIKWVFDNDQEATAWTVETVWNASLHIMGSRTFHDMAAYWPTSTEVFAPPMNRIPKAVFSRQGPAILKAADTTASLRDARANAETASPQSCSLALKVGRRPMWRAASWRRKSRS